MPTPLPLTRLFAQLQAAGFRLDTRRKLRLWRALHARGADYVGKTEELKYLLAPLIATTAAEQERFYKLWDEFLEHWDEQPDKPEPVLKRRRDDSLVWWRWIAKIIVLAVILWYRVGRQPDEPARIFPLLEVSDPNGDLVRQGDTLQFNNRSLGEGADSLLWEVVDMSLSTHLSEKDRRTKEKIIGDAEGNRPPLDTGKTLNWVAKDYGRDIRVNLVDAKGNWYASEDFHIHCANPPKIDTVIWPQGPFFSKKKYPFAVKTERDAVVRWAFGGHDTLSGPKVDYAFQLEGQFTVTCIVARPKQEGDCYEAVQNTFTVGSDKPFLQLADLQYDEPRLLRQIHPWVWPLFFLPLLFAAVFLRRWWRKRRRKPASKTPDELATAYPIHDSGPYHIPYRPNNHLIGGLAAFFRMAEVLSRREEDERRSFDATASINATIESGGFPSWRERALSSPPDYLVLVTRRDERDQQGRLFERLTSFLKNQDAPITVFFHDGSFRRFWNPDHPAGLPLHHLAQHFADHQLVLLGDGHGLLNPYDTRRPSLLAEVAPLLRWRKRLLLTPSPVAAWSYQEALLHQHFLLYPADTDGLLAGFEALEALEEFAPDPFVLWETAQGRNRSDQSDRYRRWDSVEEHRDFLQNSARPGSSDGDPAAFRWLCALAVTTQPDYALTLAIGHALGIEVTHNRLLRLSRIPWLSANEPATALRLALLAQCAPDDERLARQATAAELEAVREQVAGSFAETDWRVNLAIHQFALDPRDETHKQAIRELRALGLLSGGQEAELDWIVRERADGAGLPAGATQSLDAWLDTPEPKRWWTGEMWAAVACVALSTLLVAWGFVINNSLAKIPVEQTADLPFWQSQQQVNDAALRLHNEAVGIAKRLAVMPPSTFEALAQDSIDAADTLFKQAIQARGYEYPLAADNYLKFYFNENAQSLNYFLSDSADAQILDRIAGRMANWGYLTQGHIDPTMLAGYHCQGLCYYYLSNVKKDTARLRTATLLYREILAFSDSTYFDSLRTTMPVNLETLLQLQPPEVKRPPYTLNLLVLDARTRQPAPNPSLSSPRIRGDAKGRLSARFPEGAQPARYAARLSAEGYVDTLVYLSPRTDRRVDTIFLAHPPSPLERGPGGEANTQAAATDTDGDGIPDPDDQCITQPGSPLYKGCPTPTDPVERLKVEPPTEALILEALKGFPFDKTAQANREEQEKIINYIDASIEGNLIIKEDNGDVIYIKASFTSGYSIGISVGSKGKNDRYGVFLITSGSNSSQFFEIIKNTPSIPLPDMIRIAGGTLTLGCTDEQTKYCQDDEKPAHPVTLSDFALSRTEVTNAQYAAFLNEYGSTTVKSGEYKGEAMIREHRWSIRFPDQKGLGLYAPQAGYDNHPVVFVTWYGATEYCRWLSERTGQRYRLPTEAEWEYAARGGQKANPKRMFLYAGSDEIDEVAWCNGGRDGQTHPVAQKKPNALGLYDMSGNVYEWCSDWYGADYYKSIAKGAKNPMGPDSGDKRVCRGGSWGNIPETCRSARRISLSATINNHVRGFRVARDY